MFTDIDRIFIAEGGVFFHSCQVFEGITSTEIENIEKLQGFVKYKIKYDARPIRKIKFKKKYLNSTAKCRQLVRQYFFRTAQLKLD